MDTELVNQFSNTLHNSVSIMDEAKVVIKVLIAAPLITMIMPKITKTLSSWLYKKA